MQFLILSDDLLMVFILFTIKVFVSDHFLFCLGFRMPFMERLGHKNIKVTMERYVFNTEKMQTEAVELFEAALK